MRFWAVFFGLCLAASAARAATFVETYPALQAHRLKEPRGPVSFGVGISPISLVQGKALHALSAFQVHYIDSWLDDEIINLKMGLTSISGVSNAGSRHVLLSTAPKLRLSSFLSVGPMLGYEFVSFPEVTAILKKGGLQTQSAPFSASGIVYGVAVSQMFPLSNGLNLKISELFFKQTYATDRTSEGWEYQFDRPEIENDSEKTAIKPGYVLMLEIALLF